MREAVARYHHVENPAPEQKNALAILGSRYYEGRYQYEVRWEGEEDTTWEWADTLNCIELIENYEIDLQE